MTGVCLRVQKPLDCPCRPPRHVAARGPRRGPRRGPPAPSRALLGCFSSPSRSGDVSSWRPCSAAVDVTWTVVDRTVVDTDTGESSSKTVLAGPEQTRESDAASEHDAPKSVFAVVHELQWKVAGQAHGRIGRAAVGPTVAESAVTQSRGPPVRWWPSRPSPPSSRRPHRERPRRRSRPSEQDFSLRQFVSCAASVKQVLGLLAGTSLCHLRARGCAWVLCRLHLCPVPQAPSNTLPARTNGPARPPLFGIKLSHKAESRCGSLVSEASNAKKFHAVDADARLEATMAVAPHVRQPATEGGSGPPAPPGTHPTWTYPGCS